ncbi:hypothetical protein TNCV_3907321 [Trichonephila clavipes]|nr:hypothetical protein TNCV_3907321 [Trichonephila clavipes]
MESFGHASFPPTDLGKQDNEKATSGDTMFPKMTISGKNVDRPVTTVLFRIDQNSQRLLCLDDFSSKKFCFGF